MSLAAAEGQDQGAGGVSLDGTENSPKRQTQISGEKPSTEPLSIEPLPSAETPGDEVKTGALDESEDGKEPKNAKKEAEKTKPQAADAKSPETSEPSPLSVKRAEAGSIETGEVGKKQAAVEALAIPVSEGKAKPGKEDAAEPLAISGEKVGLAGETLGSPDSAAAPLPAVSGPDAQPDSVMPATAVAPATAVVPGKNEGDEKTAPEVATAPVAAQSQAKGGDADSGLMNDAKDTGKGGGGHSAQQGEAATGATGAVGEKKGQQESKVDRAVANTAEVGVVGALAEINEDTLEPPTWENGYYPTQEERIYRGDWDYPRSLGGITPQGPDNHSLNSDGLFPYDDPGVVDRPDYDSLFVPANRVLGFFAPREAYVIEGQRMEGWSFATDASLPLLTRSFDPERAHFKAGPLYMDLLYVGVGTIWSDYRGDQTFQDGYEPGWIPYIEFAPRILLKITDQFYLSAAARLVYLPVENRIGFDFGYGGDPLLYARLNYQREWNGWNFILYDEINANTRGILSNFNDEAFQQAGRYSFGIIGTRSSSDPFDTEDIYVGNTVGAGASTAFLQEDWRLWLNAEHRDFWRSFDFDNHGVSDILSARVGYNGTDIPFAPYVEYSTYSYDHFDSLYNTVYAGVSGRLTENITAQGRVGYLWTYDVEPERESPLWELGLTHRINENTSHSLWLGETWESDNLTNETALARYVRYSIAHRVNRRLSLAAYAQWSEDEDLVAGTPVTDRENYAGMLNYQIGDYTSLNAGVYYERERPETEPAITDVNWIYRAGVVQQIYSRYTLNFYYQYEDQTGNSDFDEDMFQISLRRYF